MKLTKIKLKQIIREEIQKLNEGGGESAGSMELDATSVEDASKFADKIGLKNDLPDFVSNYKKAKKIVSIGRTKRKDMPVINDDDVKKFQARLEKGEIDIRKPFAKDTSVKNPFPAGLSGMKAKDFLKNGLKDGSRNDDIVGVTIKTVMVKNLKPIQKQIYFDKSAKATAQFGVEGTTNFLKNKTFFITSKDNFIIDGHHRFLSAMLVDPNMKVHALSVDLPIKELLPLSLSYGDSIGNKRNA